jgi:phenol hydroxylase P4 protein
VNWEKHLMFCAPLAIMMPPDVPFSQLVGETLTEAYGYHPDMAKVDWDQVEWTKDNEPFEPRPDASLADNGIQHRTLLRFTTPGLNGIAGSAS